ncbi:hypothetical protein [Paenibacillus sp. JDR-2]|uniref:hypothetical protein n=1 Tax=Paenibacillus sp. (strain JDR-2) TaxID=324057 RepID=UPI000166AEF9|nr:hypothetical protein [Paenibacillus sp. JDR-2]ACS98883.1 hypothetical protein Pjdr2_0203 [Paenibacillus sp. JDR-2]
MMESIVYDQQFNSNELYVISLMTVGFTFYRLLPRTPSPLQTCFNMLISVTLGLMFDHTIAIPPFDFYDVGDRSSYEFFDFISYLMYAPFGYLYIYGFERFRISGIITIGYILVWAAIAILFEWLGVKFGVFHYKHGYCILYSIPIYLVVLSIQLWACRAAFSNHRRQKN